MVSLADKIMKVATPTISTINLLSELSYLKAELSQLKQLITSRSHNPSHQPSRSRPNSPACPRSNTSQLSSELCWYHQRFGSTAQKCRSPCSFPGNDQVSHLWRQVSLVILVVAYFSSETTTVTFISLLILALRLALSLPHPSNVNIDKTVSRYRRLTIPQLPRLANVLSPSIYIFNVRYHGFLQSLIYGIPLLELIC